MLPGGGFDIRRHRYAGGLFRNSCRARLRSHFCPDLRYFLAVAAVKIRAPFATRQTAIVLEYRCHRLLNPPLPGPRQRTAWRNLHGSALALAVAETAHAHDGMLVVALEDQRQLRALENELGFFLHAAMPRMVFPTWECLPYDIFSPHQEITSARLRILARLPSMDRGVLLTTCGNLMQRLAPVDYVLGHSFSLAQQQRIDVTALRERLARANYAAVNQVVAPGEFALRGGLVDIFPMGADTPFRLDLFDDEIESIRYFDPDTQRSAKQIERIELLPAREFPMTEDGVAQFRQNFRRLFEGDPRTQKIYTEISQGHLPAGAEFFLPLFFERTATLFDYLPADSLWLLPPQIDQIARILWAEIEDRYQNAQYDRDRKALPPDMLYLEAADLQQRLDGRSRIICFPGRAPDCASDSAPGAAKSSANPAPKPATKPAARHGDWHAAAASNRQFPVDHREESPYRHLLAHLATHAQATQADPPRRVLLAVETAGRRETMEGLLATHHFAAQTCGGFDAFMEAADIALGICVYPLQRGLSLPDSGLEIIAESQLYGERVFQRRRRRGKIQDPESIIRSLAELHDGDPVVHIEHGVGRYRGLTMLDDGEHGGEHGGQHGSQHGSPQTEFLTLEYQHGDKLYVPVLSLNLIGRFVGGKEHAPLHRLGGERWQKSKKRARQKAYDVAAELLEIEALRNARHGRVFTAPDADYQTFVSRFGFEETADQLRAIDDVRADLAAAAPMDRLVCGDVGFGKTEVALRAAFIAARSGCQVALLAPTTLLAQQHYQTFIDRFADLSITVEVLSRFKTKQQAAALVASLKTGAPRIVIGTHRLLQADIGFQDLGLLIIDEEHRFGVRQKEKIKQLRSQVDLLTLTATPIPRTLNIAMAGLRAISLIATPPPLRLSVKTFIREWSRGLVREACLREIRRGGQIYFLHNEVRSIQRMASELAELVPEADINIGHGQMPEARLERVMQDFSHQRFNLLVCSTIVESGIDIPSANTIIIHRADRFGLAQLHQLRGRVGRSHHQAFAYLLIPERQFISADAKKRLDAFGLMEELGAGFALASHDLEIRGAGEILGETQSGLIDDVGFSLYSEYLKMAIASLRENSAKTAPNMPAANIDLHVPALFPPDYLAHPHARLMLYKRIASAADHAEIEELQIETIDRFGLLPDAGKNLFRLTAMRLTAEQLGIRAITIGEGGGDIEFTAQPRIDPSLILNLAIEQPRRYRLSGPTTLTMTCDLADPTTRIETIEKFLAQLSQSE